MFGHLASSQTVANFNLRSFDFICVYFSPDGMSARLSQSGLGFLSFQLGAVTEYLSAPFPTKSVSERPAAEQNDTQIVAQLDSLYGLLRPAKLLLDGTHGAIPEAMQ